MAEKFFNLLRRFASRYTGIRQNAFRSYSSQGPPPSGYEAFANPIATHVPSSASEAAALSRRNAILALTLSAAVGATYYAVVQRFNDDSDQFKPPTEHQQLLNWSGTHEVTVESFYQPESIAELESIVRHAHQNGLKIRCVGSGLSPNALSFEKRGMVSLGLLDSILSIDQERHLVTVQAGARVQEVADALRPHGLTLVNYASIREQTVGGFTQVSAHGTGATIPPVDDSIVALKMITPALGTLELSKDKDPDLFYLSRVGLGCLGVMAEVTLQCIPAHRLIERTFVTTPSEVKKNHFKWLKENKHLRYMWIPNTDSVVVVQCNDEVEGNAASNAQNEQPIFTAEQATSPMRDLAIKHKAIIGGEEEAKTMTATQLRDALLAVDPLNPTWVATVNAAEAQVWKRSSGTRIGWSDEILGFDCGGQQWVLEVAFPCGTVDAPSGADLMFMEELLQLIKRHNIAAPAPIEQRWTSGSASPMSPAHGAGDSLHSWVGIIMYLPENDALKREEITDAFMKYASLEEKSLFRKFDASEHWAKIEIPDDIRELEMRRSRLASRYPLNTFNAARKRLDPKNILGNELVDTLIS